MTLTLFSISIIILINIVTNEAIESIQKEIDITIQLHNDLTQNEIDTFLTKLKTDDTIENIDYKSKKDALEDFKARFRDKVEIISFLDKLGQNPLYASITVVAKNPSMYDKIINTLESNSYNEYVKEVRGKSEQTKRIQKLLTITDAIKKFLLVISIGFSLIALLIILNTIRVTIYTRHQEISIMKLVGATYTFITYPFLVEGLLYGIFATLISTLLFFPIVHYIAPVITEYFNSSENIILTYYLHNLPTILSWQVLIGSSVGIFSAYLAVHRYWRENETNRKE